MTTPPPNVFLPKSYWIWANRKPDHGQYTPETHITTLKPNEVFVFGSNASGFHGAGAAGFAFTGKPGNQYRLGNPLLRAPKGTKGCWAVLGQARGYQEGTTGRSYAITTIQQPGHKQSIPLDTIRAQVEELYTFARAHPELTFFVPQSGQPALNSFCPAKPSLNGYTHDQNASCYL